MQRLLEIMRKLRAPDGCPWDREQTHESLRPYLLEEAAEAVDAIAAGDPQEMVEELGDVLLQVAFHAVIAEEEGTFGYREIEDAITDKLIRRHPHVFGDVVAADASAVVRNWQAIKQAEKGGAERSGSGVPHSLPALMRAAEVSRKLRLAPPANSEWLAGIPPTAEAIGQHLLAVAQYAREHGIDPELALRDAVTAAEAGVSTGGAASAVASRPEDADA